MDRKNEAKRTLIALIALIAVVVAGALALNAKWTGLNDTQRLQPKIYPPRDERPVYGDSGAAEAKPDKLAFTVEEPGEKAVGDGETDASAPRPEPYALPPVEIQQRPEPERRFLGSYQIYGYDTCVTCCGKSDGITASGTVATVGRTCAAPYGLAFGTRLWIDGIGERVVEDRGYLGSTVIDVLCEDHHACYAMTGVYDVYVIE